MWPYVFVIFVTKFMIRVCVHVGPKYILLMLLIYWANLDSRLCVICALVMCGVSKKGMTIFG